MKTRKYYPGKKTENWLILNKAESLKDKKGATITQWHCECLHCGNKLDLRTGYIKRWSSCGCKKGNITHNKRHTPEYANWNAMISRCNNPNSTSYCQYGALGITVCNRWLDYNKFLEDMGPKPGKNYTIDRINNDLGYYKENCRWATKEEQAQNQRRTKLTPESVKQIRTLYKQGATQKELSQQFKVALRTISSVVNHKTWKNIT